MDISKINRKKRRERLTRTNEALEKELGKKPAKIQKQLELIDKKIKLIEMRVAIKRKQRKTTIETLKRLRKAKASLEEKANTTELVKILVRPICRECEYFRGSECGIEKKIEEIAKTAGIPSFPKNKVQFSRGMYDFKRISLDYGKISLILWEKRERKEGIIKGIKWIEEYYGESIFEDITGSLDLIRKGGKGRKKKYFLIYTATKVVPLIADQGWLHIIAYCPTTTCVLSFKDDKRKVKFFRHKEIIATRNYYFKQRQEASPGYFKRPRLKESRKIKLVLHNETRDIADYLMSKPGKVTLLNIQKELYKGDEVESQELNRKLRYWDDRKFTFLMRYKLELRGFYVEEKGFNANNIAICPYCKKEIGGTWQDLVIIEDQKSLKCQCGRNTNTNLAIALTSRL